MSDKTREALAAFVQFHSGHVLPAELAQTMARARAALAAPDEGRAGSCNGTCDCPDCPVATPGAAPASPEPEGERGGFACRLCHDTGKMATGAWCLCGKLASPPSPAPRQIQSPKGQEEAMHDGARESRATPPAPSPAPGVITVRTVPEPGSTRYLDAQVVVGAPSPAPEAAPCPECGGAGGFGTGVACDGDPDCEEMRSCDACQGTGRAPAPSPAADARKGDK